jgi:phosphomannomutase
VRVDFADGWVHLRASNTEPIVRIIAEAATEARADELCELCKREAGV